jgi:tetratricopeptide (TPR) repeat protein
MRTASERGSTPDRDRRRSAEVAMRNRLLPVAVVIGLLPAALALAQGESSRSQTVNTQDFKAARVSYEKAAKLFEQRDLAGTVKELDACLKRAPAFSAAHFLLAKIAYLEKRYPDALADMERAEATFEETNALYFQMQGDRLDELQRRFDEKAVTIQTLYEELQRAPVEQQLAIKGRIQQEEQDRETIRRQLYEPPDEVVGMPAEYHFFHGNVLLRLDRLDDASLQYREALKIRPNYADASNNLASMYFNAGHVEVARDILDEAEANGAVVNADLKKAVLEALQK